MTSQEDEDNEVKRIFTTRENKHISYRIENKHTLHVLMTHENSTIGNLITNYLKDNKDVLFIAYRMTNDNKLSIKLTTTSSQSPILLFENTLGELMTYTSNGLDIFQNAVNHVKSMNSSSS